MNTKPIMTTLASAEGAAAGSTDLAGSVKAFRETGQTIITTIAGLVDYLEEPLKAKFLSVKDQINTALAGLPETDKVPAASEANAILAQLLSVLARAQDGIKYLGEVAQTHSRTIQTVRASMPAEITGAINAKIASGELVTKADHEAKLTEAKTKTMETTRASLAAEQTNISNRRTTLATAKLPIPGDEMLMGEDSVFNAKKTTAETRVAELKPFGLPDGRLTTLAWNTDAGAYAMILDTLKETKTAANGGPIAHIAPRTQPGGGSPTLPQQQAAALFVC